MSICVVDQRRPYERAMVCQACRDWLDRMLAEIADLWAQLPDELEPGAGGLEPRVSGSHEAPLPLRIGPLDLTMPARQGSRGPMVRGVLGLDDDQVGDLSVATELETWARDWHGTIRCGDQVPPATVAALVTWLRVWLETACDEHPGIDEFAADMARIAGRLRAVLGQTSDRKRIGTCPVTTDGRTCGATLTADPWIDIIECPRCSSRWDRAQWEQLGSTIRAAREAA